MIRAGRAVVKVLHADFLGIVFSGSKSVTNKPELLWYAATSIWNHSFINAITRQPVVKVL